MPERKIQGEDEGGRASVWQAGESRLCPAGDMPPLPLVLGTLGLEMSF